MHKPHQYKHDMYISCLFLICGGPIYLRVETHIRVEMILHQKLVKNDGEKDVDALYELKLELNAVRKDLRSEIQRRTCLERELASERKTNEHMRRELEQEDDDYSYDRKCANLYILRPVKLVCLTLLSRQLLSVCVKLARERSQKGNGRQT